MIISIHSITLIAEKCTTFSVFFAKQTQTLLFQSCSSSAGDAMTSCLVDKAHQSALIYSTWLRDSFWTRYYNPLFKVFTHCWLMQLTTCVNSWSVRNTDYIVTLFIVYYIYFNYSNALWHQRPDISPSHSSSN